MSVCVCAFVWSWRRLLLRLVLARSRRWQFNDSIEGIGSKNGAQWARARFPRLPLPRLPLQAVAVAVGAAAALLVVSAL